MKKFVPVLLAALAGLTAVRWFMLPPVVRAQVNTFCAVNVVCTVTSAWTFSSQIASTVSTGTAPFSIASTTVVPNLNSQLHGGLIAPASAIVGINDTQTLTAKTLTSPTITGPTTTGTDNGTETLQNKTLTSPTVTGGTIDAVPFGHASGQVSAATNFGTALTAQTVVSSLSSTGMVSLSFNIVQVTAGVGCSAATNSATVNIVNFTTQSGAASSFNPSANMNITGNGAVDSGEPGSGVAGFNDVTTFAAKSGTLISYTTTSVLGSTGCTTTPQYVIYAKAIF